MFAFWAAAGVLSAAAAAFILMRAARAASQGPAADPTPALYRRQLAEIDDLAARDLIAEPERKSAHAEAARRLLAASDHPDNSWAPHAGGRHIVLAAAIAAPALALGLYLAVGRPGMPDQPFARRLESWRAANPATLTAPEFAALLTSILKARPDPEGYRLLAIAQGASSDAAGSVRSLRKALALAPERADLWSTLGEALVFQGEGAVGPDAAAAFQQALKRDPTDVAARFHLGRAKAMAGDKAGAAADWRALLAQMPAGEPRRPAIEAAIAEAQGTAPDAAPAVTPQMIRGMVEGLAQRLAANPDDPEGWVRLVRAYAVLGEAGRRDAALATARARYAARPDILKQLDDASRAAPPR